MRLSGRPPQLPGMRLTHRQRCERRDGLHRVRDGHHTNYPSSAMNRIGRRPSFRCACRLGVLLLLVGTLTAAANAQPSDVRPVSPRPAALVTTGVHYQRYMLEDDRHIEEISFPIYAEVPLGRSTSMSLRTSPATVRGRDLAAISGLSDAQFSLSHFTRIGGGSIVLSLGLNLPTGKRALTQEEFETTVHISRNFYDFRTPAFGQGFNASPGATLALPLSDHVVLGVGAAYQYKGGFEPLEGMDDSYQPGGEVLLTGGLDVRLMPATAVSADVTYTRYGTDEIGSEPVFQSGHQVVTTMQFLKYWGFDELRVVGRYRDRGRGSHVAPGADPSPALQALSNQFDLFASYRMRTGTSTSIGFNGGVYYFDETDVFSSTLLFSLGAAPEMSIANFGRFWTRFAFRAGDFLGLETAAGITIDL